MSGPEFLEADVVLFLHDQALREYGGVQGVKDEGMLHSALGRPENKLVYADTGIPDLFEGNLTGLPTGTSTSTSISVNGQQVASMAALPPEVQALMRQAFGWPATPGAPAPGAAPGTGGVNDT